MADGSNGEILGVLAGLATTDMDRTVEWLTMVLGHEPSARPMPTLADWYLGPAGTVQVVLDPERAGGSLVTLHVNDIAAVCQRLSSHGIDLSYDDTSSDQVNFAVLHDPDGNGITVVEAKANFAPQG